MDIGATHPLCQSQARDEADEERQSKERLALTLAETGEALKRKVGEVAEEVSGLGDLCHGNGQCFHSYLGGGLEE